MSDGTSTWRFPRAFWTANLVELFERAAYYGTFIALTLYLSRVVGMSDAEAGFWGAAFGGFIYLLPFFTGTLSDRIGFRPALMIAFTLLSLGYGMLGAFSTRPPVMIGMFLIVLGGAFVKPIITGTVAKSSDEANRARAFSLFYMTVNIGAFLGKTFVKEIRQDLGVANVPWFSAACAAAALVVVALFYWPRENVQTEGGKSVRETLRGMLTAMTNWRFSALIVITAGFWAIQGQLYASMPKYVLRLVGEGAAPEWYANINPFVVVILVVPITHLVRKLAPEWSILIALGIIPISALAFASAYLFDGNVDVFGFVMHPVTLTMIIGIALQGLAECFLSPKWLEYASKQAPEGEEGLYLGYAHLNTFFAWLFGFAISGVLLEMFCPDPATLSEADQAMRLASLEGQGPMPEAYAHAHYLWYAFALIGLSSFAALWVYVFVTRRLDAKKAHSVE